MPMETNARSTQQIALGQDLGDLVAEALGVVRADGTPGPAEGPADGTPAVSTGAYAVDPPFFGDGDIGRLAVCSVVNDLAATGAEPRQLALGIVLEAGLPVRLLHRLTKSLRAAAAEAGVTVAAVDTRVVRAGEADRVFIAATAIGRRPGPAGGRPPGPAGLRPGDRILVTAPLGDHAAHLMSLRGSLGYEHLVPSDCAPLTGLLAPVLPRLRHARPVTTGGLAGVLRDCAAARGLTLHLDEQALPVRYETRAALAALGVDPLHAACAGVLCLFVAPDAVDPVLTALRAHPQGRQAVVVGEVAPRASGSRSGTVRLIGADGGTRPLTPPPDQLPARL